MPVVKKNPPKSDKVAWVKGQGQTRDHHCHWPSCDATVPPALWGCYRHWMKLPVRLRDAVWEEYQPGQEVLGTPSAKYLRVAEEVQAWIRDNFPCKACEGSGKSSKDGACAPCAGTGVAK